MSTTTNGSFNSLLDNVLLDQSQNFEDVSSSSIVKSSNDSDKVKIRDEAGSVKSDSDFEYHPMFTSRTYVKVSAHTPNFIFIPKWLHDERLFRMFSFILILSSMLK